MSSSQGISILHGPHQVAQKLIRTALLRSEESWTDLPSERSRSVKSGATEPTGGPPGGGGAAMSAAWFAGGLEARLPTSSNAVIPMTTQRTTMTLRFTIKIPQKRWLAGYLRYPIREYFIHPTGENCEAVRNKEHANHHQQDATQDFNLVKMPAKSSIKLHETVQKQ